jgi:hypothetical protein
MSITITAELVEGSTLSQSADGYTATRVFIAKTTAGETKLQVLSHPDIPQYADIHPDFDGIELVPIYALSRSCTPEENDPAIFRVSIEYRRPDYTSVEPGETANDALIQIGSSVTASKTEVDNAGSQIIVTLSGQPDQTGSVEIQVPEMVLVFTRRESSSPLAKALTYAGKINSASLGGGTFAAQTLLCLGIDADTNDGGISYNVTYRFQYRPGTWVPTVVYIDPNTDMPHEDVVISTNTGVVYPEIYEEDDFITLALPWNG